ncbi:hypothetical protein GW17_00042459 [Ensete ventricosum]|uniref:Uncharacterized protein n=1 Tax=Ensete ventricosum TaxID=4639 RepID=A0A427A6J2_ENSVE|nr:hypothetical protein B296_00035016 [Ensete ventricosum]RWV94956.1 hypothetical protein GW17_00042459 [Ensete ventricosum]RZR93069.1 hypothetical protein BHM03_00021473 [Ensete ventricosum]
MVVFVLVQPPPPVNDTNPYNVFRPREKAHRLHTRRVSITVQINWCSQREEKKRLLMECEVNLQRVQMKYKVYARR